MLPSSPFTRAETSKGRADDLIAWLRDYAENHMNIRLMDERRMISPQVVLDFGNRGLLGLQMPLTNGGAGLTHADTMRVLEQLAAIDCTIGTFTMNHNFLGLRPIQKYATPAIHETYLTDLASGRALASFALTEPGAGSNPRALLTTAVRTEPNGWLLCGTKNWIGSAGWASVINVFARHVDSGQISGFVVPRGAPGLRIGPEALTLGINGMVQNQVYLDRVPVSPAALLGEANRGLSVAQDAMEYARLGIGAGGIGIIKRSVQLLLRYASRRTIATGLLLENPVTLAKLSELTAATTALQCLTSQCANCLDRGIAIPPEISAVAKIIGSEYAWQATDTLVQTLGGRGYIETNMAARMLRNTRALRIFEGPTETLTMFLGGSVINRDEAFTQFLALELDVPHIDERLRSTVDEIRTYQASCQDPKSSPTTQQQWLYKVVGDVALYGLLLAVLESVFDSTPAIEAAISWAEHHFARTTSVALSTSPPAPTFQETLRAYAAHCTVTIGDIEALAADEDRDLDLYLRRDFEG